jgi:peptidylprolyl isomerase
VRRRLIALTLLSLVLFGTAACGNDAGPKGDSGTASGGSGKAIAGVTVSGDFGSEPTVKIDPPLKADSAETEVVSAGDGNPVVAGQKALFQLYIGNGTSGKKALSTYDQGVPLEEQMSPDQFFKVIVDALVGKARGSRVAIAAPVKDVWGASGVPQLGLKASDTVVFVADITSVQPKDVLNAPEGKKLDPPKGTPVVTEKDGKVTGFDWSSAPKKAPTKLTVIPLVEGTGPKAQAGRIVTFNYFGEVYGAKKPFDESYTKTPVPFGIGVNHLIPAWDKAIPGLRQGSRVLIIAPPKDGYKDQSRPGIPANSTLVFVVDVLGVDS